MKKFLLPEKGNFYKVNLHCHTDLSDGSLTPEQVKEAYKAQGYAAVAFTDHDILIDHSDLSDPDFIALNGFEVEINQGMPPDKFYQKTCHICFVALEPDNLIQPCWHRGYYLFGNAPKSRHLVKFDENEPDYVRQYTPECASEMMRIGREKGFFVTYNHPGWSMETYPEYINYHGMHAMEIYNHSSGEAGFVEYNPKIYDEILLGGERIFCVSTDDNHNRGDDTYHDSFGGYAVVKAEKLDYRAITSAMVNGDMYASMGPEITELYVEDGKVHVKCSPAAEIILNTGKRHARSARGADGALIGEAAFALDDKMDYFRLTVTDASGKHANTRAYFIDEIGLE